VSIMSKRWSWRLILLSLMGFAAYAHSAESACGFDMDVPALVRDASVVIFGEVHGTVEAPAFVGAYACWLQSRGYSVVVGLEIPSGEQQAIVAYIKGSGSLQEREDLLRGAHWQSLDGRASEAMLTLIDQVRQLRQQGSKISIFAFDGWSDEMPRDELMASNIVRFFEPSAERKLVILVGNIHAMKATGGSFSANFEPMAYHLLHLKPVSLSVEFAGGAAWHCSAKCEVHPLRRSRVGGQNGFQLGISVLPGYDGRFLLPTATPSPPAREGSSQVRR